MSTMTAAQMASDVLENLGVKAAGQSASAEDQAKAEAAVASVYSQHKRSGVATYDSATIPEWAQIGLRDCVSYELALVYGVSGQRLLEFAQAAGRGMASLQEQTAGKHDPRVRMKARYF